jgi:hypothetical protein
MTDLDLFAIGCGVTFTALAGAYAFLRERFLEGTRRAAAVTERRRSQARAARGAARRHGLDASQTG